VTGGRHVVVVAAGDVPARDGLDRSWPGWAAGIDGVVVADGGLRAADELGLTPTMVVGDLDSADPPRVAAAAAAGVPVIRTSPDKDESDTELAVLEAVRLGATRITVLGALGGPRLDHELANVWLLALDAVAGVATTLLDDRVRVALLAAPQPGGDGGAVLRELPGLIGATVSLLPFGGDVEGVTTRALRYPLRDEPLTQGPARGLSNVRTGPDAAVTIRRGRLLIVESAS
jgi:thiamine pyrophosphokinase